MVEKSTKSALDLLWECLDALPETGPCTRAEVWTLYRFSEYLVNFLERERLQWRGTSFKNNGWSVLMVMKVARDKVPLVAFITERSTRGCMRVFLRRLNEHAVNWVPDKFA